MTKTHHRIMLLSFTAISALLLYLWMTHATAQCLPSDLNCMNTP